MPWKSCASHGNQWTNSSVHTVTVTN